MESPFECLFLQTKHSKAIATRTRMTITPITMPAMAPPDSPPSVSPSCDAVPGFPVGPAVDTKGVVVGAEVVVVFTARKEKIHSLDWHADYSGGLLDHRNKAYHQKAPKSK